MLVCLWADGCQYIRVSVQTSDVFSEDPGEQPHTGSEFWDQRRLNRGRGVTDRCHPTDYRCLHPSPQLPLNHRLYTVDLFPLSFLERHWHVYRRWIRNQTNAWVRILFARYILSGCAVVVLLCFHCIRVQNRSLTSCCLWPIKLSHVVLVVWYSESWFSVLNKRREGFVSMLTIKVKICQMHIHINLFLFYVAYFVQFHYIWSIIVNNH